MSEPRRLTDEELQEIARTGDTLQRQMASELLALRDQWQHILRQECGA